MDTISQNKQEIQLLLSEHPTIGIILSENQSIDSIAAALSLHLALQDSGKNSQIISVKEPIVEHSFLVGIDQISQNFSGIVRVMTVSFPYKEGEIEKVSYNIEGDRLNVNLFAEENGITFSEKDVRYIKQGSAPTLIFTIGVSNPQELERLIDPKSVKTVNIDNLVTNSLFGDAVLVDASYSSISEIVAKLTQDLGLQVEFDVAQNMLDGIAFATNNFSSPKTSPLAFEMAGVLMSRGAVRKNMKDVRPQSQDTSLQMLGNKPPTYAKAPADTQSKQFGQSFKQPQQPFGNTQGKQKPQPFDSFGNTQDKYAQGKQGQKKQINQSWNQAPQQPRPVEQPRPDLRQSEQSRQETRPQQPQPIEEVYRQEDVSEPFASRPAQPQSFQEVPVEDQPAPAATIPTEDEAPSDWFTPKVFKSNKN